MSRFTMRSLLVPALVAVVLVTQVGLSLGTSSQGQAHRHTNKEGEKHRHHVPQRPQKDGNEYRDPKKPPPIIRNPKLLEDNKLVHDTDHIKEHLEVSPEHMKNMSNRELDYHYFKVHDLDDNRKLDGLELLAAISHVHGDEDDDNDEEDEKSKKLTPEEKVLLKKLQRQRQEEDWKFYIEMVDEVLADNDKNNDGYIHYGEYINGRKRKYGQKEDLDNLE